MSELITLKKSDADFSKYLLGHFSKDRVAIPLQSLNINSEKEQITFKLIDQKNVSRPSSLQVLMTAVKVRTFNLVLIPVFLVIAKLILDDNFIHPYAAVLTTLALMFSLAGFNMRNDFVDHVKGIDRVQPESGSRVIQAGWLKAYQVKRLSNLFLGLGVLLGLPALFASPILLITLLVVAALSFVAASSYQWAMRYRKWSEFLIFLLLGPLLTVGFSLALQSEADLESIFIGVVAGLGAVFYLYAKNFYQLVLSSQLRFNNTMTWLGFDKGKKWLWLSWFAFLILFNAYHLMYESPLRYFLLVASVMQLVLFTQKVRGLKSPAGSAAGSFSKFCAISYNIFMGFWVANSVWQLGMTQFWRH